MKILRQEDVDVLNALLNEIIQHKDGVAWNHILKGTNYARKIYYLTILRHYGLIRDVQVSKSSHKLMVHEPYASEFLRNGFAIEFQKQIDKELISDGELANAKLNKRKLKFFWPLVAISILSLIISIINLLIK